MLLQVRQHHLQVGGDHLGHVRAADDLHEPLHVEDRLLRHDECRAADQQGRDELPERDVEALGSDLREDVVLAHAEIVGLRVEVVEHSLVLAHHPLGLTGGAGREVDVGEPVGADLDTEVRRVGPVALVDAEHGDGRAVAQRLVEGGGAPGFREDEGAAGTVEDGADAIRREVRLDRHVDTAGLEHGEDGRHPVQVALRHHGDGILGGQAAGEEGPGDPVRVGVEFGVRDPALSHDRGGLPGVQPHALLEELVEAPVRKLPHRTGHADELVVPFPGGEQAAALVRGVRFGGDAVESRVVIAGDPGRVVGVEVFGAVRQHQGPAGDRHPEHHAVGQCARCPADHGLESVAGRGDRGADAVHQAGPRGAGHRHEAGHGAEGHLVLTAESRDDLGMGGGQFRRRRFEFQRNTDGRRARCRTDCRLPPRNGGMTGPHERAPPLAELE